ncbi:MAG: DNA polymerase III subunit beta [Chloroflexi bacterium]|nr:DNA polymerase III subunit beta [Chloroflexota bacterium]
MKVSCLQENLAKGLSIVGRAVAPRSTLPVLANILLETDRGRLKLSATNLEIGINCWIGAKVLEEGAVTVPARLLSDFVTSLPSDQIDMDLNPRTQTLNLRCMRYEANIKGIDAQEFPPIPTNVEGGQMYLEPNTLHEMINQVTFAAATDESRPILTGVLVQSNGNRLTFVATDGFRISVRGSDLAQVSNQSQANREMNVIIPARALIELGRISAEQTEPIAVTITESRNQVIFQLSNITLVSQLIEGTFPPYQQILPKNFETRTVVNTQELLKGVKIASLFARDAAHIVRLQIKPGGDITPGSMVIRATAAEVGDNVSELDAMIEGKEVEIAFNAKYLLDVLSVIAAERTVLQTINPLKPGLFNPLGSDDFIYVIMPMQVTR